MQSSDAQIIAAARASTSASTTDASRARFYKRKVVRDLLWGFSSPHMIAAARFPVLPTHFGVDGAPAHHHPRVIAWLAALEEDPSHLIDFLQGTTRSKGKMLALGVYFAALLEYWLRFCPLFRVERFELGKQIVSATNQTIGQLKFLFHLALDDDNANASLSNAAGVQAGEDFHVESSVKFFLLNPLEQRFQSDGNGGGDSEGTEALVHIGGDEVNDNGEGVSNDSPSSYYQLEQFVGPHLGENLAWRVQEVARKLDMCQGESVQSWLCDKYSDRVKSHIALRGYLFYPLSHFVSTSEVTQLHDWEFHANPTSRILTSDPLAAQASCHPSIAPDHLRGWWTSDIEAEFQRKVLANNNNDSSKGQLPLGESRFVVLPKLHWLSPIIAVEDSATGEIVIDGETTLGIEMLRVITLAELIQHTKHHFHVVAASPDAQANGAVVMPLLISELVRCRPGDLEFDGDKGSKKRRWKELSRGFALDPRYWDPLPLCHDAVRFRRVNNGKNDTPVGEREYEGRRDWVHDGVIKPSDEEIAKSLKSKQHEFANPEAMCPDDLCEELLALFPKDQKRFTHANLKKSICTVFQCQGKVGDPSSLDTQGRDPTESNLVAAAEFVLQCLQFLVLGERKHDAKVAQRVGHLVLDAFEAQKSGCSSIAGVFVDKRPWQRFFLQIIKHKEKWSYLFLALRASDLICLLSGNGWSVDDEIDEVGAVIEDLLSYHSPRWNAIAVETMKVFRLGGRFHSDSRHTRQQVQGLLDSLMGQEDWKSAEQLAILSKDLELLQIAFKRFSLLNMPKVLKRLRKVLVEYHTKWDLALLNHPEYNGGGAGCSGIHAHTGPPIDHSLNRSLTVAAVTSMTWEFVDSTTQIDSVLELLKTKRLLITNAGSTDFNPLETMGRMLIGIDCEWRPKFLSRSPGDLQNEAKARVAVAAENDGDGDEDLEDEPVDEHEGLSVYQLAVSGKVFVIDVQVLGEIAAKPLRFIWDHSSSFAMVGFCVTSDLKRMAHSFPGLLGVSEEQTNLLVELKQFAMYRQLPASKWGLSQLSRMCLDDEVDKEQQCSDWGARPLSPSQLEYAAKDAFAVRNIALHLLADVQIGSASHVIDYLRRFAVVTGPTAASFGHWVSVVQPLNQSHVRAALRDLALESVTSFHTIAKGGKNSGWDGSVWTRDGLVVKTIAVLIRSASSAHSERNQSQGRTVSTQYAAVVVQLDKSIDVKALGSVFGVEQDELALADKETLIRIFGYSRGCVGPVGLREQQAIQVVIDESLMAEEKLLCGAGEVDVVYAIAPDVLANAVDAGVAHVSTM